ncbi:hypothetical protein IJD44_01495 [bacterium]|nr:hypothetical protein [bacterium]
MVNFSKITSALKTFSGKPLAVTSKVLGAATCAAVLYDAHVNGRERAGVQDMNDTADRFENQYNQYLTSDKESATICKMKKLWYNAQQDFPYYHVISRTKGYLSAFGSTLFKDIPLIALSVLAIKTKDIGKVAGVLLAGHGLKTFLYDVIGIASEKKR